MTGKETPNKRSMQKFLRYGVYGSLTLAQNETRAANINIKAANTHGKNSATGISDELNVSNRGNNVTINVEAVSSYSSTAINKIEVINAAPVITAKAHDGEGTIGNDNVAVDSGISSLRFTEGGKLTLEGMNLSIERKPYLTKIL